MPLFVKSQQIDAPNRRLVFELLSTLWTLFSFNLLPLLLSLARSEFTQRDSLSSSVKWTQRTVPELSSRTLSVSLLRSLYCLHFSFFFWLVNAYSIVLISTSPVWAASEFFKMDADFFFLRFSYLFLKQFKCGAYSLYN